jgi:hypothetical protein
MELLCYYIGDQLTLSIQSSTWEILLQAWLDIISAQKGRIAQIKKKILFCPDWSVGLKLFNLLK